MNRSAWMLSLVNLVFDTFRWTGGLGLTSAVELLILNAGLRAAAASSLLIPHLDSPSLFVQLPTTASLYDDDTLISFDFILENLMSKNERFLSCVQVES